MTKEELAQKMLEFIETKDGDYFDEWYATPRDFAAGILCDFAEHIGVELVVPQHIPRKDKPTVDRDALLRSLLPDIENLFEIKYREMQQKDA